MIAYDRAGSGVPLVLVGGAFSYRRYPRPGRTGSAAPGCARFTVYSYDRRGRGDSGDTAPYAVGREIEDLGAVIEAASRPTCGGCRPARCWPCRSAATACRSSGWPSGGRPWWSALGPGEHRPTCVSGSLTWSARERGARRCTLFVVDGMGAPSFVPRLLRLMPGGVEELTAVANTLPYDVRAGGAGETGRPL